MLLVISASTLRYIVATLFSFIPSNIFAILSPLYCSGISDPENTYNSRRFSLPTLWRYASCICFREKTSARSSLVESHRNAPAQARRSLQLVPLYFYLFFLQSLITGGNHTPQLIAIVAFESEPYSSRPQGGPGPWNWNIADRHFVNMWLVFSMVKCLAAASAMFYIPCIWHRWILSFPILYLVYVTTFLALRRLCHSFNSSNKASSI